MDRIGSDMSFTRRDLLAATAGALPTVAGCLSGGSNVRYPSPTGTDASPQAAHTATPADERNAENAAEDGPTHRALARRTHSIYEEVRWFATAYPETMRQYLQVADDARGLVADLAETAEFDVGDVAELKAALEPVHESVGELLEPHFGGAEAMADEAALRLQVARRFADRGDLDRAREELVRLRRFYARRATREFVETWYPRHPIRNRLKRFIRTHPRKPKEPYLVTEVHDAASDFAAHVHPKGDWHLLGEPVREETRARLSAFEPLAVADGRVNTLTLVPRLVDDTGTTRKPVDPTDDDDPIVFFQRYESPGAANAAVDTLLAGDVGAEGTYPFPDDDGAENSDEWRQVYYDHPGEPDVAYAFLVQAGPYLLATGVSEVSWTERVDWAGPLKRTWLWER